MWLLCNAKKECEKYEIFSGVSINGGSRFAKDAGLVSVYSKHIGKGADLALRQSFEMKRFDPIKIMDDYRALPNRAFRVLTDAEMVKLNEDVSLGFAALNAHKARESEKAQRADEQRRRVEEMIQTNTAEMRKSIKVGTFTNCGQVFEVRRPMAGVQTIVGMQYIAIDRVYAEGAGCKFVNRQYVGR